MSDPAIERIKTLTQTARATWFGYLGALAFAGVTLLGIEDKDFFSYDASTQLPLIGVSVPVTSFFGAGAFLIALIYGYLHVFLEKLWTELGEAKPRIEGKPLASMIHPWLVSDSALLVRALLRTETQQRSIDRTALSFLGGAASFLLCWAGGPFVVGWFWVRSAVAHDFWMTAWIGLLFTATLWSCLTSLWSLYARMGRTEPKPLKPGLHALILCLLAAFLLPTSALRTIYDIWQPPPPVAERYQETLDQTETRLAVEAARDRLRARSDNPTVRTRIEDWFRPVPAQMAEVNLTELPADWSTHATARRHFLTDWCRRFDTPDCTAKYFDIDGAMESDAFRTEWAEARETYLGVLAKPILRERNLSRSDLFQAHLPGMDLREANLNFAYLRKAQLEGVDISWSHMRDVDLGWTSLETTNLSHASLQGAYFVGAQLLGTNLVQAKLDDADLSSARIAHSNLSQTTITGANFFRAILKSVDFKGSNVENSMFFHADLDSVDFSEARMGGADFSGSNIKKANFNGATLENVNFYNAQLDNVDFSDSKIRGVIFNSARISSVDFSYSIIEGGDSNPIVISGNSNAIVTNGTAFRETIMHFWSLDSGSTFHNSFGDRTVNLPMGLKPPCQWSRENLSDEAFFGRWRGWIEASPQYVRWKKIAPKGYEDVTPIPPPDGCAWSTDSGPDAEINPSETTLPNENR